MRILVVGGCTPSRRQIFVRAANMVTFELVTSLASFPDTDVAYLPVLSRTDAQCLFEECREELAAWNVTMLEPVILSGQAPRRDWLDRVARLVSPSLEQFYPICRERTVVLQRVAQYNPDALLVPWSESITALCANCPVPVKYAYYGNPDPKNYEANMRLRREFGTTVGATSYWRQSLDRLLFPLRSRQLRGIHRSVLGQYDLVGDVALNDVLYYRQLGLDQVFYVRNIWYDLHGDAVHDQKRAHELPENRIIGSIGRLTQTANTLGLDILASEIVPALRARMGVDAFSVHIIGAGQLLPAIDRKLRSHPEVVIRGFVDDIDAELQMAKVFLVANNGSWYKVGHTRYLHAWSLGCCVVAHVDASLSMPEIINGYNALLGRDAQEMAELVQQAIIDSDLRQQIGRNGYRTFKELFTGPVVAKGIINDLKRKFFLKQAA